MTHVTPVEEPLAQIGELQFGTIEVKLFRGQGSTHQQLEVMSRGEIMHAYAHATKDARPNANGRSARKALGYIILDAWYDAMEIPKSDAFLKLLGEAKRQAAVSVADESDEGGSSSQSVKEFVRQALRMRVPEEQIIEQTVMHFECTAHRAKGHVVYNRNKMLEAGELGDDYQLPKGARRVANRQWKAECPACGGTVKANGLEGKCRKCGEIVPIPE